MTAAQAVPFETSPVWVLSDGSAGMENQAIAVAEALGLPFTCKRLGRGGLLQRLPTPLLLGLPANLRLTAAKLAPPWPRLIIASGRRSIPAAVAVKQCAGSATMTVYLQNPRVAPALFDLVAAPAHDRLGGANVIETLGAPHRVTEARLAAAARDASPGADLPRPQVVALIGGPSRAFRFTPADARKLGADLAALARMSGVSLLVTTSRRTGAENVAVIAAALDGLPVSIFSGSGPNPYFAWLARADAIVVTADSVNMASEAAGTGKPIYLYPLPGGTARIARFHAALAARGATRPFDGGLARWDYPPVNDAAKVAEAIRARLGDLA